MFQIFLFLFTAHVSCTHAAHFACVLNCTYGIVAVHRGHFRPHPLHKRCSHRFVFKWRESLGSTRPASSDSISSNLQRFPHVQHSYIRLGVNILMTCQSLSPLVSRLAFSTCRRIRRNSSLSLELGVGSAELIRMHCSSRYAMDCRLSRTVFFIWFRASVIISDCSLIIRMESSKAGGRMSSNSSENSEKGSP